MRPHVNNLFALFTCLLTCNVALAAIAIPRSYIVEYSQNDKHNTIDSELLPYKGLYEIHHVYSSRIFHGMSFTLKDDSSNTVASPRPFPSPVSYTQTDKLHPVYNHLNQHPVIKKIYPVYEVPRPQWQPNQRNVTFPYSNSDVQIYDIHQQLNVQGQNVLIGVLDSGVDYTHPALGKGFGPKYKINFGRNLVDPSNDKMNGVKPLGKDDPFDPCTGEDAGHGTHVSGIIAGYDPEKNFTGIAPKANLAVFRVFGCQGGAGEDTIIKAMEMAYEAGCKIINLSLGIDNSWPEDTMSVVAQRLTERGVLVVGVAGNQGSDGVFSQNSPGSGKDVVSVGSIDNSFYLSKVIQFDFITDEYFAYAPSTTTDFFPNGTIATILTSDKSIPFGCKNDSSITKENANGKILFVKRGQCTFSEKLAVAKQAGAIALLFYDPNVASKTPIVAETDQGELPCICIELKVANRIVQYLQENGKVKPVSLDFPLEKKVIFPETAGRISEFSSTGPNYELDLKPSLTGIGGDVYSSLPLHVSDGWGVRSGTSMSAPHVAGAAALLINYYVEQKIKITPKFITEKLQNNGRLIKSDNGRFENPVVQGAGLIQPYDSIRSKLHIFPSQISFNDTASATKHKTHTINVVNSDNTPIEIILENIPSQSIQPYANISSYVPTEPAIRDGNVTVNLKFSSTNIRIPAMSSAKINVKVILPDPRKIKYHYQMYGGFIGLTNVQTQQRLATVPYFGVLGRMIDIPLFDKGYPYLTSYNEDDDVDTKPTDSFIYDRRKETRTRPAIAIRLLTGSAQMEINVRRLDGTLVGPMDDGSFSYNQRNKLSNYDSVIEWNGKIIKDYRTTPVPDGVYYLHLKALKHFGNAENAVDWQEWKSGPILVKS